MTLVTNSRLTNLDFVACLHGFMHLHKSQKKHMAVSHTDRRNAGLTPIENNVRNADTSLLHPASSIQRMQAPCRRRDEIIRDFVHQA